MRRPWLTGGCHVKNKQNSSELLLRGAANKSLAWPSSPCRRTESTVSLWRVVCSCAELQFFFLLQRLRGIMSGDAYDFKNMDTRAVNFFSARQGAEGNSFHSDRNIRGTCNNVCHCQKLGGDFSTCDAPRPGRPKAVTNPEIFWSNSRANLGRRPDFG